MSDIGAKQSGFGIGELGQVSESDIMAELEAERLQPTSPELVKCDCGHWVHPINRMMASLGTSCPDCYDRMSE